MKLHTPKQFIITKGSGESNLTIHAGSYHMALYDAGIHEYNIITYSSILPKDAELRTFDQVDMPLFGSEMPCIAARMDGHLGDHISAGIAYAWLYNDLEMNERIGGIVCELGANSSTELLEERLRKIIQELKDSTFGKYVIGNVEVITEGLNVSKMFGTVIVSICFLNFNK